MKIKLLSVFILSALFIVLFLPTSLATCIPDGCNFNQPACGNNACANETINQHLNERASFFNAILKYQSYLLVLGVLLILFFVARQFLSRLKILPLQQCFKHRIRDPEIKLFNPLIEAFSNGILHPKIY